jgi:hypothetical protein
MKLDSHTYSNFEPLNQQSFKAQGLKKKPQTQKGGKHIRRITNYISGHGPSTVGGALMIVSPWENLGSPWL